jgi:hypothetical protein
MTDEETRYCLETYERIRSNGAPRKVFYPFSGPDLSTVLLKTNARHVTMLCLFEEDRTVHGDRTPLEQIIEDRRQWGYYDKGLIAKWDVGLWRLVDFEFRMLGIDIAPVFTEDFLEYAWQRKTVSFVFSWKHPRDALPRERTVTFVDGRIPEPEFPHELDLESLIPDFDGEPYDLFYTKGNFMRFTPSRIPWFYRNLLEKGYVTGATLYLIGIPFVQRQPFQFEDYLEEYADFFKHHRHVPADPETSSALKARIDEEYGWRTLLFVPGAPEKISGPEVPGYSENRGLMASLLSRVRRLYSRSS